MVYILNFACVFKNQCIADFAAAMAHRELPSLLGMLYLDAALYFVAAVYLEEVLPSQFGIRRHPLFCIPARFRSCCCRVSDRVLAAKGVRPAAKGTPGAANGTTSELSMKLLPGDADSDGERDVEGAVALGGAGGLRTLFPYAPTGTAAQQEAAAEGDDVLAERRRVDAMFTAAYPNGVHGDGLAAAVIGKLSSVFDMVCVTHVWTCYRPRLVWSLPYKSCCAHVLDRPCAATASCCESRFEQWCLTLTPVHSCGLRCSLVLNELSSACRILCDAATPDRLICLVRGSDPVVVRNLRKVFPGRGGADDKVAIPNLSLSIPSGQCFGLLGENGCGKTTTINILTCVFPPTAGNAIVNGADTQVTPCFRRYCVRWSSGLC